MPMMYLKHCSVLSKVLNDLQNLLDIEEICESDASKLHGIIRYILRHYCQSDAGLEKLVESKYSHLIERIVKMSSPDSAINKDILSMLYNCSKNKDLLAQLNTRANVDHLLQMTNCPNLAYRSLRFLTTCIKHDQSHIICLESVLENDLGSTRCEQTLQQLAEFLSISVSNVIVYHRMLGDATDFNESKESQVIEISCQLCQQILSNPVCNFSVVVIILKIMSKLINYFDNVIILNSADPVLQKLASCWCFNKDTLRIEDFLSFFKQFSIRNFTRAMYIEETLRNKCIIELLKSREGNILELLMLVHRLCKDPAYRSRILTDEVRWALLNFLKENYTNEEICGECVSIFLTISGSWDSYNQAIKEVIICLTYIVSAHNSINQTLTTTLSSKIFFILYKSSKFDEGVALLCSVSFTHLINYTVRTLDKNCVNVLLSITYNSSSLIQLIESGMIQVICKVLKIDSLNPGALEFCGVPCYTIRDHRIGTVTEVMYLMMCNLVNETKAPQQLPFLKSLIDNCKRKLQLSNQAEILFLSDFIILCRSKSLMDMIFDGSIPFRIIFHSPSVLLSLRAYYRWISWKINPVDPNKLNTYRNVQHHDRYRNNYVEPKCGYKPSSQLVNLSNGNLVLEIDEMMFRGSCEAFDIMLRGGFKESNTRCVNFGYLSDDGLICLVHMLSKCSVEFPNHVKSFNEDVKRPWKVVKEILTVSIPYFIESINKEVLYYLESNVSLIDFDSFCGLVDICQFLKNEEFCECLARIYLSRVDFEMNQGVNFNITLFGVSIENVILNLTSQILDITCKSNGGLEDGHYEHDGQWGRNSPGPCHFVSV